MSETGIRVAGLAGATAYAALIGWLFASQPQTLAEFRGGLTAAVNAYEVDAQGFSYGLRFFENEQFEEARLAFKRADPAMRDARTQFYIAYSYYRQGWGRTYHDDALYAEGLKAVDRAIAAAPGGHLAVNNPGLKLHTADELKIELQQGLRRDASDFNPLRLFLGAQVTAVREALTLPVMFLSVTLLGALRPGDPVRFVYPTVFALVLGLLFLRLAVQSGTLAPARLVNGARSRAANANGVVVLMTLWLAASQILALLLPDAGLPRLVGEFFLLALLLNTAAAAPDDMRFLRSMAVTFGALFLLKFVLLAGLSAPADGRLKRLLQTLLDGVTLGVVMQPALHPAAGYLSLAAILVFLLGMFLLPRRQRAVTSVALRGGEFLQ